MKLGTVTDIEAIERVPLADRLDGMATVWDVIDRAARRWPDRVALRMLSDAPATPGAVERDISYRALRNMVVSVGEQLRALGIGRGDVVSFLLPNLPETHFVLWAAETVGIANPVNWMLDPDHIADILIAAETRLLVLPPRGTEPGIWDKAAALRARLPSVRFVSLAMGGSEGEIDVTPPAADLEFADPDWPAGSDVASYFHTGGTSGSPKIAPHTHANEVFTGWATGFAADVGPGDVLLCGLPLFHVNAAIVTGVAAFQTGATVLLFGREGYRNRAMLGMFWEVVARERVTFFSGVPTVYAALLDIDTQGRDLSSLRYAICGAAPMPTELIRRFEARTGVRILEGYGLTEGTCVSAINPRDGERRPGSIGLRIPYQQMKIAILDEAGRHVRDCASDEAGAVLISGPNVFPGYKNPADNARLWAADGWLNTGDLGRRSADGYFWLTGRAKELIIRGGHNIDPKAIEQALYRHPAVISAAAVGQLDAYAGEVPVAFVALKPGDATTPADLLAFARPHIGERAAVPVRIEILDALPITAVGKIFKPRLGWLAAEHALTHALREALGPEAGIAVTVKADERHGRHADIGITLSPAASPDQADRAIATALSGFAIAHHVRIAPVGRGPIGPEGKS